MSEPIQKLELPFDFLGNIAPWEDRLISGDMEEAVKQLESLSPLDAARLVLFWRRSDSNIGSAEIDELATHLGVFDDTDDDGE